MDEYASYAHEKGDPNDTTGIIDSSEGFQDDQDHSRSDKRMQFFKRRFMRLL